MRKSQIRSSSQAFPDLSRSLAREPWWQRALRESRAVSLAAAQDRYRGTRPYITLLIRSRHVCHIAPVVRAVRQSSEDAKRFGEFCGEEGSHRTNCSPCLEHAPPSRVKDAACRTVLRSSPAAILLRPPICMDAVIAWTLTMSVRHTMRGAPCAPWTQLC